MSSRHFERSITARESVEINLQDSGVKHPHDWREFYDLRLINIEPARKHLNSVDKHYFDALSGTLEDTKQKLALLKKRITKSTMCRIRWCW